MKNLSFITIPVLVLAVASAANADAKKKHYPDHMKNHPRQDEVNKRLDNQSSRVTSQEKNGKITAAQAAKIKSQDAAIYKQEQADKQLNGGNYITKGQQAQLNKEENKINREDARDVRKDASGKPFPDKMAGHPRQDEVNGRLDNQVDRARDQYKDGEITKGQEKKMISQDKALYKQEQADKQFNGGNYVTKGQQAQLNKEENKINREDGRDVKKDASSN